MIDGRRWRWIFARRPVSSSLDRQWGKEAAKPFVTTRQSQAGEPTSSARQQLHVRFIADVGVYPCDAMSNAIYIS